MKLSVWQQFSSNHSNDFAMVGHFKSIEDAKQAAEELKMILQTVHAWYEAHPSQDLPKYENGKYVPVEIERRIAAHYGVEWNVSHDWIVDHSNPENNVLVMDQWIFVDSPTSWSGYEPFDTVLRNMGAQVNTEHETGEMRIYVDLDVLASTAEKADSLATIVRQYLKENYKFYNRYRDNSGNTTQTQPIPPWIFYAKNRPDAADDEIKAAHERQNIALQQYEALAEQWRELKKANVPDGDPRLQNVNRAIEEHRTKLPEDVGLLAYWFMKSSFDVAPLVHGTYESVTVNDQHLQINNLWFSAQLGNAIVAINGWLRSQGCEVEMKFREGPYPDEEAD